MRLLRPGIGYLLCILVLPGCGLRGGKAATAGPGSAALSRCPAPIIVRAHDPGPVGIRIRNEQADSVAVFLDRCTGHVRVGDVGPGAIRTFRLQPPLFDYGDGLRFFVYPGHTVERFYVASLVVDTARVLELTVRPGTAPACETRVYVDGERYSGSLRDLAPGRIAAVHMEYVVAASTGDVSCPVLHVRTHGPGAGRR